jgi:glucose/arabinose dehydrogenase
MRRIMLLVAVAAVAAAALASTATGRTAARITAVASGLDHPNGIAFAQDGTMYVSEMGHGGDACYAEPNFLGFGDLGTACYGQTGAISRIKNGRRDRIVDRLFSMGVFGGAVSVGPTDVAVDAKGQLLIVMAARAACQPTDIYPWWARAQIGKLLSTTNGKHVRVKADIGGLQCARGTGGSYPGGIAADSDRTYVADGGSGDMLMLQGSKLSSLGSVAEAYPLSVAIGPDGAVYAGVCNCSGTGKVLRYTPNKPPTVVADGLGWVTGIAFGPDGTLYVADEHFDESDPTAAHGEVLKVGKNGAVTAVLPQGRLEWPGHIVTGPDGALYVVNHAQWAAAGEILRIKL